MPLDSGTRLGHYEILAKLGEGGMGEVYRARDTRLNRDVALKVLPADLTTDPDRLKRFRREAQALAALNHPNIAHVHGLEEARSTGSGQAPSTGSGQVGMLAIVMELVEGDDLSAIIARGPVPPADALPIARQIADALEAAHEHGIVHRDLKPGNVKVRPDGTVKVLDFGLAKTMVTETPDADDKTTIAGPASSPGAILGTAAYMSPEQARGKAVDKRTDVWAFGVLLYEMLTGARAFTGEGLSDVLAAVVRQEIDWRRLPGTTPPRLRALLERCLTADLKQRLRDIGEARIALAAIERNDQESKDDARTVAPARRSRWTWLAWSAAALAVVAALYLAWQARTSSEASASPGSAGVVRLSIPPPPGLLIYPDSTNVAISPDGRLVAFVVGTGVSTENQLWVRPLDSTAARRIEGGDGVSQPFWSPDSQRIGFFAGGKLKTVATAGGAAEIVCDAPFGRGATWSAAGVIVFAKDANGPLYRVSANTGTPVMLTELDTSRGEVGHRFPVFLPDGDHFLFAALPRVNGAFEVFASSLSDGHSRTRIGSMDNAPAYAEPGWLLFTRQGVLAAQPFDQRALKLTGEAVSLGDQPAVATGPAAYDAGRRVSASTNGSLAYYLDDLANTSVEWIDLAGKPMGSVSVPAGRYTFVALAPDGKKAVLQRSDSPVTSSLWLADLTRASAVPIEKDASRTPFPVWSPDSTRIAFAGSHNNRPGILELTIADASVERRFLDSGVSEMPRSWSRDGAWLFFNRIDPDTKWNVYGLRIGSSGAPVPVVHGPGIDVGGTLSPDGHWLAFQSDEAGRLDVWLQSFPNAGNKIQISTEANQQYWWSPDGRQILLLTRNQTLLRVDVDLRTAVPHVSPPVQLGTLPSTVVAMDLAPDGKRFLALVSEHAGVGTVTVVQNWREALAKR